MLCCVVMCSAVLLFAEVYVLCCVGAEFVCFVVQCCVFKCYDVLYCVVQCCAVLC